MILIAKDSDTDYYLIDEARDLEDFRVGEFNFFHLYGIADYRESFAAWLRRFPRPTFIVGVKDRTIISFIYIDAWEELPFVVNVLRAQETVEKLRGKKIGYKMFLLGIYLTPEYMITKPLTMESKRFYTSLGFIPMHTVPMFENYHQIVGYLLLPNHKKREHIEKIREFFTEFNI